MCIGNKYDGIIILSLVNTITSELMRMMYYSEIHVTQVNLEKQILSQTYMYM